MTRLAPYLATLALFAVAPVAALAQSPFSPIPPAPGQEPVLPENPAFDDGIGTGTLGLILLGVMLMLVAAGYFILRDARSVRPVDRDEEVRAFSALPEDGVADGRPGAAARARAQKARAKQKAARKARKVTKRAR